MTRPNPFDITKAVDFNDTQIGEFFVDMPNAGFSTLANLRSPMPMLIMGGKGSGKTHIMRYFSYQLQRLRDEDDLRAITKEGFIGIYLRCGGLNANRFSGKGQSPEAWDALFGYYLELWLGQLVLGIAHELLSPRTNLAKQQEAAAACLDVMDSYDIEAETLGSLEDFARYLQTLQKQLDIAINNSALTQTLKAEIRVSPGRFVFGLPQLLSRQFPELSGLQFLYLIDEYENFTERQQRYVNTLLREKELPCSFKIGGRTYGFKTWKTFSDQEDIKEGSEYEMLSLDQRFRSGAAGDYELFAKRLCLNRLRQAGVSLPDAEDEALAVLRSAFQEIPTTPTCKYETAFVLDKYQGRERPYFSKLRNKLEVGMRTGAAPGIATLGEIDRVIKNLQMDEWPLLEKLNIFLLYMKWRGERSLVELSQTISRDAERYVQDGISGAYARQLEKRRADLLAQLLRECDRKQQFFGFDLFVKMSEGIPRNLLVILKSIVNWATFQGEDPFGRGQISTTSQSEGVRDAAEWFFDDARQPGDDEACVRDAIKRLATLFREVRFSDKPSEKAVYTFSLDLTSCSQEARRILLTAERWSMLLRIPRGQKHKNSRSIDEKFYLNTILSPKWDLPVGRGGTIGLQSKEVDSIFVQDKRADFIQTQVGRVGPMMAPHFGGKDQPNDQLFLGELNV